MQISPQSELERDDKNTLERAPVFADRRVWGDKGRTDEIPSGKIIKHTLSARKTKSKPQSFNLANKNDCNLKPTF